MAAALILEFKDYRDPEPPPLNLPRSLLYDAPCAVLAVVQWLRAGAGSLEVDERRGFKLAMGKRTSHRASQITCDARAAFLLESRATRDAGSSDARIQAIVETQGAVVKQLDGLSSQIERLASGLRAMEGRQSENRRARATRRLHGQEVHDHEDLSCSEHGSE